MPVEIFSRYVGNWQNTCLYIVGSALQQPFWNAMQTRLRLDGMTRCKMPLLNKWCWISLLGYALIILRKGHEFKDKFDASSLATEVLLEADGSTVDHACWLRPVNDARHINLAELYEILKGVKLAFQRKETALHLVTYSACVHRWIIDILTGKIEYIRRWLARC